MRRSLLSTGLALALIAGACGDDGGGGNSVARRPRPDPADAGPDAPTYGGSFTVLESADHGPQMCYLVATSYPPQCGGLDLVGWDWSRVDGEERAGTTIWGDYQLTGTYVDGQFTLTEPPGPPESGDGTDPGITEQDFGPACDDPDVVDAGQGIAEWTTVALDDPAVVASWVTDPGPDGTGPFVANVVVLPGSGAAITDHIRETYGGALCLVERQTATQAELSGIQAELFDADARVHLGTEHLAYPDPRRGTVVAAIWLVEEPAADYAHDRWGDLVELRSVLKPAT